MCFVTPQQETSVARPRPVFRARSASTPPGFGCARLATLASAPPHPGGVEAEGRKTNYRKSFTPPGMMILDSRNKAMNTNVSHSVFTQKFKAAGDAYEKILDMPIFGHSDNHAGIQAADLLCSAFLFPMAAYAYCLGHVKNCHVHYNYHLIRDKFGRRLKRMQYRYQGVDLWWHGGISTSDGLNAQASLILFGPKQNVLN